MSTRVWAHPPGLHWNNWGRCLRMIRKESNVEGRLRSKWMMVRRFLIQIIAVQYWLLCSVQSTTNLNKSVLIGHAGFCKPVQFGNWMQTEFLAWVFNSRPARNKASDVPGLGNMVCCDEMGLDFRYARSAGGRPNGSWQDFYPGVSGCNMQIPGWKGCCGVTTINIVGEYPWKVGEYGTEWLSQDFWWRTGVVSVAETAFSASPPFRDPYDSTWGEASADFRPWMSRGGPNAWSGSANQECHWQDDIFSNFKLVNWLQAENAYLTHEDLNTGIDKPDNRWNIHLGLYDSITFRPKPSSHSQQSYSSLHVLIFDDSHWYNIKTV